MSTTSNFLRALLASRPTPTTMQVALYFASFDDGVIVATDKDVAYWSQVSERSVKRARDWMVSHGLIEVESGRWKGCQQRVTVKGASKGCQQRVSAHHTETSEIPFVDIASEDIAKDVSKGCQSCAGAFTPIDNINNNLSDNKQGCSNSRRRVREKVGDLGLVMEEPKKKRTKFTPPTLEEVRAYFGTRKGIIPNWFDEAKNFFDYWDGIDWQQKPGVHITKWKTRADKWIERTVNEQKPINQSQDGDIYDISSDPARRAQAYAEGLAELLARDREIEATDLAY